MRLKIYLYHNVVYKQFLEDDISIRRAEANFPDRYMATRKKDLFYVVSETEMAKCLECLDHVVPCIFRSIHPIFTTRPSKNPFKAEKETNMFGCHHEDT